MFRGTYPPEISCSISPNPFLMTDKLHIVPITQSEAKLFISRFHRHHRPPVGSIFQVACSINDKIVGVAMAGRPVSRNLDNGFCLEVNRLTTDGTKNACSILYAAAWRAAKALGYTRLITYILSSEPGTSLRASGWKEIGIRGGRSWNCPSRPRIDKHPTQHKILFEAS